jgi:Ca2+-binding RTX toxin-like protein
VNGTDGPDVMTVVGASGDVPRVFVEGWNVAVARVGACRLSVNGLGGDDTLAAMGPAALDLQLDGGEGNDRLFGGVGPERLLGGPGDDVIDGGPGADLIFLGEGDDTFTWDPGDGSDLVDGEAGRDVLIFNGSSASEDIDLRAGSDGRLRVLRNIAAVELGLASVERVDVIARAGTDRVFVNDLSATDVEEVNIDLAPVGDFAQDVVVVRGTPGADTIAIAAQPGEVLVSGLAVTTRITSPEPVDHLVVQGAGGADVITPPSFGGIMMVTIE